ncbi:MAG: Hsp20/alpha crystallin family protein [Butyrivibrio sp.]|nr:Hsp20/alpha crystallin family protein [Butyrivibrio sp.]
MFMPSLFGENLLDDFFDVPGFRSFSQPAKAPQNIMHTDVKEKDNVFEIAMNLPGFKKENVQAELKDGYLTVTASTNTSNDTKDDEGRYIRRERYSGSCSRRFYVGEQITEEDIKARFEDGVLKIDVPKVEAKPIEDTKRYIAIEG